MYKLLWYLVNFFLCSFRKYYIQSLVVLCDEFIAHENAIHNISLTKASMNNILNFN